MRELNSILKPNLKKIILLFVAVIVIIVTIFLNIPHNLNSSLRLYESEWIHMTVVIMENIAGQIVDERESFIFEKGTVDFAAINDVFNQFSYNRTLTRDRGSTTGEGGLISITILAENNSTLILFNTSTSNSVRINGTLRRMRQSRMEELIGNILDICEMQIVH